MPESACGPDDRRDSAPPESVSEQPSMFLRYAAHTAILPASCTSFDFEIGSSKIMGPVQSQRNVANLSFQDGKAFLANHASTSPWMPG
jgi:hypothetical protein